MPPDVAAQVFEPFFTTKPLGQGTGLGLSMLYGFVKQSEGHVRVYSEEGRGTTVRLYLPRHREGTAEADVGAAEPDGPGEAEAGETVLVVEDEAVVRQLVVEVLQKLGYPALEAADGPSGLRVLFITGCAHKAALGNGVLEPGMAMISKPFTLAALGTKIRTMIKE